MVRPESARDLWARLATEGKPPVDPILAAEILPVYTVALDSWIGRISRAYFEDLSRRQAHYKLVLAPYGGGKTHFLLALAQRALAENFVSVYVPCSAGLAFTEPLAVYRAFVRAILLPDEKAPGLGRLLARVVEHKKLAMANAQAPDVGDAFRAWVQFIAGDYHPEPAFGRVMAEALRSVDDPAEAPFGEPAVRWLSGEVDSLTREELAGLKLPRFAKSDQQELGRNLFLSMLRFIPSAGVHGTALLFDEVETLATAIRGKALQRLLGAIRVMLDLPTGVPGGIPLLGVFAATPDVLASIQKYQALAQRLAVSGSPFEEGNDRAAQLDLSKLGVPSQFLIELGNRLVEVGRLACDHDFDESLQHENAVRLARVATERNLAIDARRLFVKAWVSLLDFQVRSGERVMPEEELSLRYQGVFDDLKGSEEDGE